MVSKDELRQEERLEALVPALNANPRWTAVLRDEEHQSWAIIIPAGAGCTRSASIGNFWAAATFRPW